MKTAHRIRCDSRTAKWFREQQCEGLFTETTLARCEKCCLHYKPSLGHDCKVSRKQEAADERSS